MPEVESTRPFVETLHNCIITLFSRVLSMYFEVYRQGTEYRPLDDMALMKENTLHCCDVLDYLAGVSSIQPANPVVLPLVHSAIDTVRAAHTFTEAFVSRSIMLKSYEEPLNNVSKCFASFSNEYVDLLAKLDDASLEEASTR